jgi:hypothetical protein
MKFTAFFRITGFRCKSLPKVCCRNKGNGREIDQETVKLPTLDMSVDYKWFEGVALRYGLFGL